MTIVAYVHTAVLVSFLLFAAGYFDTILRTSWPGTVWCNQVVAAGWKESSGIDDISSPYSDVTVVNHLFMNGL